MRTARTIGIKEDGSEVIIHPKKTAIGIQVADFAKMGLEGIPKPFVLVEFQTSDGKLRSVRFGPTAGLKDAHIRADEKLANRQKILEQQAKEREAKAKAEAAERQKRINELNAAKEAAKAAARKVPAATK